MRKKETAIRLIDQRIFVPTTQNMPQGCCCLLSPYDILVILQNQDKQIILFIVSAHIGIKGNEATDYQIKKMGKYIALTLKTF